MGGRGRTGAPRGRAGGGEGPAKCAAHKGLGGELASSLTWDARPGHPSFMCGSFFFPIRRYRLGILMEGIYIFLFNET